LRVLLIGPFPPPITGNSLVNKLVTEHLPRLYSDIEIDKIDNGFPVLKEDIGHFSISKVFFYLKRYLMISKIINADKIYIAIGITFFGVLKYTPFIFLSRFLGKEVIVHVHSNHLWKQYELLEGIKKRIFHYVLSKSNKGIVLSDSLKRNLNPFLDDKQIYVLENFAEDFLFESSKQKNTEELRIIFLSNLMLEKGIVDLLEALLILQDQGINFKAKIGGGIDSNMEKTMFAYFERLSENLEYLGVVYGDQKKELLEWGNIFVFPTYYRMEGQPICIFEAMATGNIILTTEHAGIPDVFKEEVNGFYIEKKSPNSIAAKLKIMSNNMTEYKLISERNIKEASEKYRVEKFISKLNFILKYKI
jgi:glycosyltransferase involved in cell wall biosynthesis